MSTTEMGTVAASAQGLVKCTCCWLGPVIMVTGTGTDGVAPCRLIRTAPLGAVGPPLTLQDSPIFNGMTAGSLRTLQVHKPFMHVLVLNQHGGTRASRDSMQFGKCFRIPDVHLTCPCTRYE